MICFNQIKKSEKLMNSVKKKLMNDFVGIDEEIEKIIDNISPWHCMPESHLSQPHIINIWGMTGTGKTDLVRKLSSYINHPLIEVDLGSFKSDSSPVFGYRFYDKYRDLSSKKSIILLDEFQKCSTVGGMGADVEPSGLRDLWALLSDGMIPVTTFYDQIDRDFCKMILGSLIDNWEKDKDEFNKRGYFTSNNHDKPLYRNYMMRVSSISKKRIKKDSTTSELSSSGKLFLDSRIIKSISLIINEKEQKISSDFCKDIMGSAKYYLEKLEEVKNETKYLNFKNSIIIICGNLDDVYSMSHSVSPDIDIDTLYKKSKMINVPEVKLALSRRFRPEQIARLGNNHIVYKTLSRQDYLKLIRKDLNRVIKNFKEQFGIDFKYDETIVDLIYSESVYPSQGVRPIFSTIQSLIRSTLIKVVYEYMRRSHLSNKSVKLINFKFDCESDSMVFNNHSNGTFILKIDLSLKKLNEVDPTDEKVRHAIHEAGHALTTMLLFKDFPEKATIYTPNYGTGGYIWLPESFGLKKNHSRNDCEDKAVVTLAGKAAESLVFGDDLAGDGCVSDYEYATDAITNYATSWGMYDGDIVFSSAHPAGKSIEITEKQKKFISEKMNSLYDKSYKILSLHERELLILSNKILNNKYLLKEDLKNFCIEVGLDVENKNISLTDIFNEKLNNLDYLNNSKTQEEEIGEFVLTAMQG